MTSALGASTVPSVFSCKEGGLYCVKSGKPCPPKAVFRLGFARQKRYSIYIHRATPLPREKDMEVFAVMIEPYGFVDSFGFEDARLRLFVHKRDAEAYRKELVEEGYDGVLSKPFPVL
jgi:hypothetical protein